MPALTNKKYTLKVTPRQFDTMLAALRLWQRDYIEGEGVPVDFADIAFDHGDALTTEEIDSLIKQIN